MNAFTPYIANEHLARLMIEAEEARSARQARAGSSPAGRLIEALRSLAIRRRTPAAPALA